MDRPTIFFHVEGYYLPHLNFFKEEATPSTLDLTWITLAQVIKHIGTTWKQLVRKTKKWSKEIAISSNSPNMITWDCSQTDRSSMDPRCPRWLTPSHDRPCPQRGAASHVKVHPGRQKVGSSWNWQFGKQLQYTTSKPWRWNEADRFKGQHVIHTIPIQDEHRHAKTIEL